MHSETRPIDVRKPRTLGPERNQRIGTIGKNEGRLVGGNAAMVLSALGKPQPEPIDADLLQGGSEIHLEAGPS